MSMTLWLSVARQTSSDRQSSKNLRLMLCNQRTAESGLIVSLENVEYDDGYAGTSVNL